MEIDPAAERLVDARSARRLVPLELADVSVPPSSAARGVPALFFRVLGRPDGSLRIELWERGEYHGARVLSGAGENPQLFARRVALAAAELGRRLARKREASLAREAQLQKSREQRLRIWRERTQEGPLALRSEFTAGLVTSEAWLAGTRLAGEIGLHGALRLDVGAELWGAVLRSNRRAELEGVTLGPAYRFVLGPGVDLDVGVRAAALLVQVPTATMLDGVSDQNSSWTARLDGAVRLQFRITRQLRAGFGIEYGALLRDVSYVAGARDKLGGTWAGLSLSLVATPPL